MLTAEELSSGQISELNVTLSVKRDDKQYEICKQRGHRALIPSTISTVYVTPNPKTEDMPGYFYEPDWNTCAFCGRQFRLVTKMEER